MGHSKFWIKMSFLLVLSWSRWHHPGKVQGTMPRSTAAASRWHLHHLQLTREGYWAVCTPAAPRTWHRDAPGTSETSLLHILHSPPHRGWTPLPMVMLQGVRFSACTTWECTFKCNTPNYPFLCVPLNAFGIYFWSFLILFFFSTINLKD